jgi:hypothetical protein
MIRAVHPGCMGEKGTRSRIWIRNTTQRLGFFLVLWSCGSESTFIRIHFDQLDPDPYPEWQK